MCGGPERVGHEAGLLEGASPGEGALRGGGAGFAHPDGLCCEDDEASARSCFGSIELLVHSSEAQWRAFNHALCEEYPQRGAEIEWDRETYVESLKACGGRKRLRPFLESKGVAASEADIEEIYQRKTAIFLEHIRKNGVTIRPGVLELLREAKAKGLKTATVSSTDLEVLHAVLLRDGMPVVLYSEEYTSARRVRRHSGAREWHGPQLTSLLGPPGFLLWRSEFALADEVVGFITLKLICPFRARMRMENLNSTLRLDVHFFQFSSERFSYSWIDWILQFPEEKNQAD